MYSVQHFDKKSTKLFKNYINLFLAIKLRTSYSGLADDKAAKAELRSNI